MADDPGAVAHPNAVQATGLPIRPANPNVVPYGSETLDEVFNEDQALLDPADIYEYDDQGADEAQQATPDSDEEHPEAQPSQPEGTEDGQQDQIDLPEGVTLEYLDEHHPELAKVYRGMQADYTRKTQRLADRNREAGALERKAEMWDQLTANERLVDHIRQFVERGEAATSHTAAPPTTPSHRQEPQYDYSDDLDDFTPEQQSRVRSIVAEAISQEVKPYVQDLYAREATRTVKQLEDTLPGFREAKPEIERFRAENGNRHTWEEAAKLVLFEKQREMGMREAMQAVSRKRRVSSVNGPPTPTVPARSQPAALPERPSLDEALDFAIMQHRNVAGFSE